MELEEYACLLIKFAKILYTNGQATDQINAVITQLGNKFQLNPKLIVRWGELQLHIDQGETQRSWVIVSYPTGVNMHCVGSAMRVADALCITNMSIQEAMECLNRIEKIPPTPTWLFTLAAAIGAVALAVLFGVQHIQSVILIFISAALGALLRRGIAKISTNLFVQPFAAALLSGLIGALAVRYHLSSSLRLVAVCPCMILVPGPHFLNSALDMIQGRLHLGATRFFYATLIILAISMGLLFGLSFFGIDLPVDPISPTIPLWHDLIAAGFAVAAYSLFFSMPWSMLAWPIAVGMFAHFMRWTSLTLLDKGVVTSDLIACMAVGIILTLVARRKELPFAAIGFASVVSMMPGVLLFRTASGLLSLTNSMHTPLTLISATISDGLTAVMIIIAMSFGLIIPRLVIDYGLTLYHTKHNN